VKEVDKEEDVLYDIIKYKIFYCVTSDHLELIKQKNSPCG